AVREVVWQLVRLADRFAEMPAADAAGDVELAADEVVPLAVERGEHRGFAGLQIDIRGAGRQVERAYGVALDPRRLAHGHAVLERGRAVVAAGSEPATAAVLQKERGKVEVAPLAGLAVELDQRHLDLGMARCRDAPAGPEERVQVVGEALGDRQEPVVAGSPPERDRRLDQAAG